MGSRRIGSIAFAALTTLSGGLAATITASAAGAASAPSAPRSVSAVPTNHGAKVSWKVPASNGGSAITGYVVTPFLGKTAQPARTFASAKATQVVSGLTNAKAYSFKVAARNATGKGAASAASGAVIAGAPGRPGQNGKTTAQPNGSQLPGQIEVSASPPASNGAVITRYDAKCISSNGGAGANGVRTKPAVHIVLVSGMTPGKTYRCTMTATNARGTGPRSLPSNPIHV